MCPELTIPSSCKRQRPFPGFHVSFIPCSSGSNSKSWFLFLCPPEYLSPASISMTLRILKHSSNDSSEMLLAYVFFSVFCSFIHPSIHPLLRACCQGLKTPLFISTVLSIISFGPAETSTAFEVSHGCSIICEANIAREEVFVSTFLN